MIKEWIKKGIRSNVYINEFVHIFLHINKKRAIENYCKCFENDDYLVSTENIEKLVDRIKNKEMISSSNNVVFESYHMYGIWKAVIGRIKGIKKRYTPAVEHGLIIKDEIGSDLLINTKMACMTLGMFRKDIIQRKMDIPVFCVGSYIHYVESFYDEQQMQELKEKLGKVLLVFLSHSCEDSDVEFNFDLYISKIKQLALGYDTVLVNVYWWNINDTFVKRLKSEGYKIITCGFRDDVKFLCRQKSYIELSDLVVGDGIGTHIGYVNACGKQYIHINMNTKFLINNSMEWAGYDFYSDNTNTISRAFSSLDMDEKEKQRVLDYYWGNNCFKTDEEIKNILEICKELTITAHGRAGKRYSATNRLLIKYKDADPAKYILLKDALPDGVK